MDEPNLFQEPPSPEEHVKKHTAESAEYTQLSKNVTELGSRLRVLEEQYSTLRNKAQLTDHNLLDFEKNTSVEVKSLTEDILETKKTLQELKEKIDIVNAELSNSIKEHDFRVVEKYVDLWNPGQFVTKVRLKEEIQKFLREEKSLNSPAIKDNNG